MTGRSISARWRRGFGLSVSLLLLLALVAGASAQTSTTTTPSPPGGAVKVEYDEKENRTRITLNPIILVSRRHEELRLGAVASRPGKEAAAPPQEVTLIFLALSKSQPDRYAATHQLTILVDGVRLAQGETQRATQTRGEVFIETMLATLPWEAFRRLANARTATLKLGLTEIKLTPPQITLLRATASYMAG